MYINNFDEVVDFYKSNEKAILSEKRDEWAIDPYAWNLIVKLTPIEESLWHDIRAVDIVVYPQYPVGRFFVDFGNPVAKIAIECDGKQFHLDKEKDARRETALNALGWKIYRVTGSECKKRFNEKTFETSESRKLIEFIGEKHKIIRKVS